VAGDGGAGGVGGTSGAAGTGGDAAGGAGGSAVDAGRDACTSPDAGAAQTFYLSDLNWAVTPTNGWGPVERDMSNGEQAANDGHPMSIAGAHFTKGLGVHPYSSVQYNLGGKCSSFTASVGHDDEVGGGSVAFEVWLDGARVYASGVKAGGQAADAVSVDLSCASTMVLVVTDAGDGNSFDHADWADAKILCTSVPNDGLVDAGSVVDAGTDAGTDAATEVGGSIGDAGPDQPDVSTQPDSGTQDDVSLESSTDTSIQSDASDEQEASNPSADADDAPSCVAPDAAALQAYYVSDVNWVGTPTNGWGPVERDASNGENQPGDGHTISINGMTFAKGVGAHAISRIELALGARCSTFTASVGHDDEVGFGTVVFEVWVDGTKVYTSPTKGPGQNPEAVSVDVTCASKLELVMTDAGDGVGGDHGDWANASITCTAPPGDAVDAGTD
jgi:endo-alpha-N-acetylgalactosaminidase